MASAWPIAAPPLPWWYGDVHVWRADVAQSSADVAHLATMLASSERLKAARFHFQRDRERYIIAHAFLRSVLAAYVGVPPTQIALASGEFGKPHLVRQAGWPDLRFNLSHSRECTLVALTVGREVGVDVESMQPLDDADVIAKQFFSPSEQATLAGLPTHLKRDAFYRCWSRKEAFIKVLGLGLAMPLDQFSVSLAPDEPAQIIALSGTYGTRETWTLHDLAAIPEYATALALQGDCHQIYCATWDP